MLAPLPDTVVKSIGFEYKMRAKEFSTGTVFNVTYSHMTGRYYVPARTSCNMNCDDFFNIVYNPYAAMDVNGCYHHPVFGHWHFTRVLSTLRHFHV